MATLAAVVRTCETSGAVSAIYLTGTFIASENLATVYLTTNRCYLFRIGNIHSYKDFLGWPNDLLLTVIPVFIQLLHIATIPSRHEWLYMLP